MARKGGAARMPGLNLLPVLFTLISLVLVVLILVAGTHPGVLEDLYYLKASAAKTLPM
jgi:hypothetical protein